MEIVFELDHEEKNWWEKRIKELRAHYIKPPKSYLSDAVKGNPELFKKAETDASSFIREVRELCWGIYIQDEVSFHREVISYLVKRRELPKTILNNVIDVAFPRTEAFLHNREKLYSKLSEVVGDFAGRIMPYLYMLSLSTTNSRRSRAGQTFEAIVEFIIQDVYGYPYDNQSKLGNKFYQKSGLGKIVDGIIPNKEAYFENRSKCMVITMKTTLRERWQEVVEELNRTNVPHIHLLTLDTGLTTSTLDTMKQHNITVVSYAEIAGGFQGYKNIVGFNDFFKKEITYALSYWSK